MVVPIRKDIDNKVGNNVVNFKPKEEVKYRKDGKPKQTKSNARKGVAQEVYPIKDKEDIEKMKQYFRDKIDNVWYPHQKKIAGRNLALVSFGFNVGLRMSDIVKLKWKDILYSDNTFKEAVKIQEKKTKKFKEFYLNDNAKNAIQNYINEFNIPIDLESYIFKSREGGHIEVRTVNKILQEAARSIGIKYPIGTHSIRKSWAYHQIITHQNDAYFMAHLMDLMGHSSLSSTLHYAGISKEQNKQYYNDVNL